MDGKEIVKIIEGELFLKDITKAEFYESCGMNSATMSNWRNGTFKPSPAKLAIIEKYLGISFADYEKSEQLESLRDDLRILLRSASDLPPSSVYALIAQIEKEKEKSVLPD